MYLCWWSNLKVIFKLFTLFNQMTSVTNVTAFCSYWKVSIETKHHHYFTWILIQLTVLIKHSSLTGHVQSAIMWWLMLLNPRSGVNFFQTAGCGMTLMPVLNIGAIPQARAWPRCLKTNQFWSLEWHVTYTVSTKKNICNHYENFKSA